MKLKLLAFVFSLFMLSTLFASNMAINPDTYLVKPHDLFLLQSLSIDTLSIRTAVLPTGQLSLYPFSDTVYVSGKTLKETYSLIDKKLEKSMKKKTVSYFLYSIAPVNFTVIGAVVNPGEYISESTPSLYDALKIAGGLISSSSSKIMINNNGVDKQYNLNKYLLDGDLLHNPQINGGDVVKANYSSVNLKIYTNNDTINYVQAVELDTPTPIKEIVKSLAQKHALSSFEDFTVIVDGKSHKVDQDFVLNNGDKLIVPLEEIYVYVTGNVAKPGKIAYNGAIDPQFYIAKAGGPLPTGSRSIVYIIDKNGKRYKYKDQKINQGDILYVPESYRSMITAYLVPVSTVISLVSTIIIIKNTN